MQRVQIYVCENILNVHLCKETFSSLCNFAYFFDVRIFIPICPNSRGIAKLSNWTSPYLLRGNFDLWSIFENFYVVN